MQGCSLFEDAEAGEESLGLPGAGTEAGGDVGVAGESEPGDRPIPQGGQILRRVTMVPE